MKPINKKDRSKAFYQVVGLFLISFAIAMILGFTTMNNQKLADEKSKKELENIKEQLKFQEDVFAPTMDEVTLLLDKVPTAKEQGENIDVLNSDIASKLSTTKNQIAEDEGWESKLYTNVIKIYSDLQVAYKEQIRLNEELSLCQNSTDGVDEQVQKLTLEKTNLQNELNMLKAAGGGGGGGDDKSQEVIADLDKKLKDAERKLKECNTETKALLSQIEKLKK